jgi:sterol desaturase/sphingolipid hydroxylase (fatty acid hydroxylase superfamily)
MDGILYFPHKLARLFLTQSSGFSLTSLFAALLVAAAFITWRRMQRNRPLRASTLLRGLFPAWLVRHASMHADISYFAFNVFVYGIVFGWAVMSYKFLSGIVVDGLTAAFGTMPPTSWPDLLARATITLTLFLAYELGYWLDHYLKHRVPALWELHKVHHSANVLTPLTVFRIHPLDGLIFSNILALTLGLTNGVVNYLFGKPVTLFSIDDANIILVLFVHIYVHLQHTHLWIAFTGLAGRIFLSPAHHQIHHSNNPLHFDKNLGSCLAIWDWLFGTLHVPAKEPEPLSFGVKVGEADMHSFSELAVAPVQRAAVHVVQSIRGEAAPATESPPVSL